MLVGRERELAALSTVLRDAMAGAGQAVFLLGEAGIGKSRMAAELSRVAVTTGARVRRGRAGGAVAGIPFRPLAEALAPLFHDGVPESLAGLLGPSWPHSTVEHSPILLGEAVLRLLAADSAAGGCLLVLEDLHEADTDTLAVVEYLADNLGGHRVLLVATTRPEPCPAVDLAYSAAQRRAAGITTLGPLTAGHVRELSAGLLGVPAGALPAELAARAWRDSEGNPFVVEELLAGVRLVRSHGRWVPEDPGTPAWDGVPATVAASVNQRAAKLGGDLHALLRFGALLGRRFPYQVVAAAAGTKPGVRAGVDAGLLAPDQAEPGWYVFRHALTAEALLSQLLPEERSAMAETMARTIHEIHSGLPGDWCQLSAALLADAGDRAGASQLFAEASRRALGAGAAGSALALIDRALALHGDLRAEPWALDLLLTVLSAVGEVDRALLLERDLAQLSGRLQPADLAVLHARIAGAALIAGRRAAGLAQIAIARDLLGGSSLPLLDVIEARAVQGKPGPGGWARAEELALRAVTDPDPQVRYQALKVLGFAARLRSAEETEQIFSQMLRIADEIGVAGWRIDALVHLGTNDALHMGRPGRLEAARAEAERSGSVHVYSQIDCLRVMIMVQNGDYELASALIAEALPMAARTRRGQVTRYLILGQAILAGHQGDRAGVARHMAELTALGGDGTHYPPIGWGLADAVCALLEEDRDRARAQLDRAAEQERATESPYGLSGRFGLRLLLGVLSGRSGWGDYEQLTADARTRMRWNAQFVAASRAVLLGRDGDGEAAAGAMAESAALSETYPLAAHLILRLAAEEALTAGWGDPVGWARTAESFFHAHGLTAVAAASRAVLRSADARVFQHRRGSEKVPEAARLAGVTVREYEVLELLAGQLSNAEIAERLFISVRTVEKHVANLIGKLGLPGRRGARSYLDGVRPPR
ncbi:helix-turn-helix transcriptional regulator [Longispora albida]|uniref:helix-turn-helix transcriptional regulator n=1 Tax=Longispora albida TaxID=203523 RepID=UPI000372EBA2|nr:LuxR family transcriptional regulator [Longispora albida]